jgi:hypothetical protein
VSSAGLILSSSSRWVPKRRDRGRQRRDRSDDASRVGYRGRARRGHGRRRGHPRRAFRRSCRARRSNGLAEPRLRRSANERVLASLVSSHGYPAGSSCSCFPRSACTTRCRGPHIRRARKPGLRGLGGAAHVDRDPPVSAPLVLLGKSRAPGAASRTCARSHRQSGSLGGRAEARARRGTGANLATIDGFETAGLDEESVVDDTAAALLLCRRDPCESPLLPSRAGLTP